MRSFQPKPASNEAPYVIAHRGISAKYPENTLIAFEHAANISGVDMIELDVRLSKDEEVIVLHDRTLQRTSTGNGLARNYTLNELKEFDAGSWFHPKFTYERIPTLREALQKVGAQLWIDIEIKSDWLRPEPPFLLEEKILQVVQECGMSSRVFFSSFNHRLLLNLKKIKSSVITGVLYNFSYDFFKMPSDLAEQVGASIFVCAKRELTHRMVDNAHKHGIAVYVYTLNSVKDAKKMLSYGVDGIMSNNADDIIEVVKKSNIKVN